MQAKSHPTSAATEIRIARAVKMRRVAIGCTFAGVALLVLYVGSYHCLSYVGKEDCIGGAGGTIIWSFNGPRQQAHRYMSNSEFYDPSLVARERILRFIYWPMVRFDRLRGYYHILDKDCPFEGG